MAGAHLRSSLIRTGLNCSRGAVANAGLARASSRLLPAIPSAPSAHRALQWRSTNDFHSSAFLLSKETSWASKGNIGYKEVKSIAEQPTGEITIIDVREPDEVSAGMIPSAVNVPLTQFEKAFNPNGGADFQQKFSFTRPSFNDPLVFYCRSGKRSAQAVEIAKKGGWANARNYEGSWLDWVSHEEGSK